MLYKEVCKDCNKVVEVSYSTMWTSNKRGYYICRSCAMKNRMSDLKNDLEKFELYKLKLSKSAKNRWKNQTNKERKIHSKKTSFNTIKYWNTLSDNKKLERGKTTKKFWDNLSNEEYNQVRKKISDNCKGKLRPNATVKNFKIVI
jgi:hypothetical protein